MPWLCPDETVSSGLVGTIDHQDGFSIQHLPLRRNTLKRRQPHFPARSEVRAEQPTGFEIWKEARGGAGFE